MSTLLIAGYVPKKFVAIARSIAAAEQLTLAVAYERQPTTPFKAEYLTLFDRQFDISSEVDRQALKNTTVVAVTTNQERDMDTYLTALHICGLTTDTQQEKYTALANKRTFKESLGAVHPELIPKVAALTVDTILQVSETLTYPAIIKPTGLSGSAFVQLAQTPAELIEMFHTCSRAIQERSNTMYNRSSEIIAEEYLVGKHYSLNAYIDTTGAFTICPIVRVVPAFELGIADGYSVFQYVTTELTDQEYTEITAACERIATHFEIKNTSAHFDMICTKQGWKCLEVGLRIGGNRHQMFEKSHGFSHYTNDILGRLGKTLAIPQQKGSVCVLQKAATECGTLSNIQYSRSVTRPNTPKIEELKLTGRIGEEVCPVAQGGGTLVRHLIYGDIEADAYAEAQRLHAAITIETV